MAYIDAQTNRSLWRGVFILDPTALMPNSSTYPVWVRFTHNQSNPIWVQIAPPSTVLDNPLVTIALPRVPLTAVSTPCKSVTIENPSTNNVVYVGNQGIVVGGPGYRLWPGATVSMDIDDLNKVYVTGTVGNDVSYIAVN